MREKQTVYFIQVSRVCFGNKIEIVFESRQYVFYSVFSNIKIYHIIKYRNWLIKVLEHQILSKFK